MINLTSQDVIALMRIRNSLHVDNFIEGLNVSDILTVATTLVRPDDQKLTYHSESIELIINPQLVTEEVFELITDEKVAKFLYTNEFSQLLKDSDPIARQRLMDLFPEMLAPLVVGTGLFTFKEEEEQFDEAMSQAQMRHNSYNFSAYLKKYINAGHKPYLAYLILPYYVDEAVADLLKSDSENLNRWHRKNEKEQYYGDTVEKYKLVAD